MRALREALVRSTFSSSTRALCFALVWGLLGGCDDASPEPGADASASVDTIEGLDDGIEAGDAGASNPSDSSLILDGLDTATPEDASALDGGSTATGTFVPLGPCEVAEEIQNPDNAVQGATCHRAEVICEGLDPIELTVFIGRPPQGVPVKGVVTFSSGLGGTSWYNATLAKALVNEGFMTIRRRWSSDWVTGPGGMRTSSCRFATVLQWLRSRDWAQGKPLCATGNSGGASEVAYTLSAQGAGDLLDLAVVTGGPPMGRLDLGCLGGAAWESECHELVPQDACPDEQLSCGYTAGAVNLIDSAYDGTPCAEASAGGDVEELHLDSVVSPVGVYDYPQTRVHVIEGRDDCTEAAPLGMLYAHAVTSEKEVEWVDAPHGVFQSQDGMEAIRDAVVTGCVLRH